VEASCSSSEDVPISDDVLNDSDSQHSDVEVSKMLDTKYQRVRVWARPGRVDYSFRKKIMVQQKYLINLLLLHQILHDGYSFESSLRADCNALQFV